MRWLIVAGLVGCAGANARPVALPSSSSSSASTAQPPPPPVRRARVDPAGNGLRHFLDSRAPMLRARCVATGAVEETMAVAFVVDPLGKVEAANVEQSSADAAVDACILTELRAIVFPRPPAAATVRVDSVVRLVMPASPPADAAGGSSMQDWSPRMRRGPIDVGTSAGRTACDDIVEHCVNNVPASSCSSLARHSCERDCHLGCVVCTCVSR
jgi:hypothetical protein